MGWRDIEYVAAPSDDLRLTAVLQALRTTHDNGGALLGIFEPSSPSAFENAQRFDFGGQEHFVRSFLESPSVRSAMPELRIPASISGPLSYTWYSGFEFEGAITHLLLAEGAYIKSTIEDEVARQMSRSFMDALVGDRQKTLVYRIDGAWAEWFYDVAWDSSYFFVQYATKRCGLLCITDTD